MDEYSTALEKWAMGGYQLACVVVEKSTQSVDRFYIEKTTIVNKVAFCRKTIGRTFLGQKQHLR